MKKVMKPEWYRVLMEETFHRNCRIHPSVKRDNFCLFCRNVVCRECIIRHRSHPFIQVKNLFDHDAVWLDPVSKFIECSQIQTHEIDGKKLIALKPKHKATSAKGCKKLTQEPLKFCSLSCKVDYVLDHEGNLSSGCEVEEFRLLSSEGHITILNSHSDNNVSKDPSDEKKKSEKMKNVMIPEWYEVLMKESFRENCRIHPSHRRDVFCVFCRSVLCYKCVSPHHYHPFVQVTNLHDDDALWLDYISKFIDCSQIQTHEIDGKKLVLLKPKHKVKSAEECKKLTHKPFKFCSFSCKADHILDHEGDLSSMCRFKKFRSEASLQRLRDELRRLPEHRGLAEYEDTPVECFGATYLARYRGLGRNSHQLSQFGDQGALTSSVALTENSDRLSQHGSEEVMNQNGGSPREAKKAKSQKSDVFSRRICQKTEAIAPGSQEIT